MIGNIFDKKITQHGVVLAVSGGADSMTLLALAKKYLKNFSVITVNHHLREESASDAEFVYNYCKKNSIPCTIVDIYPKPFADENKISIETAARLLRYDALKLFSNNLPICLAHTKNDQAETVLMHLIRGSGAKGCSGMSIYDNGYYRPLLHYTREDIMEYINAHNIPFVQDSTNNDNNYTRNYVRNVLIKDILEVNSGAVDTISRFAKNLSVDEDFFKKQVNQTVEELGLNFTLPLKMPSHLFELHSALKTRVILEIFNRLGYSQDIERVHIDSICELISKQTGRVIMLPFGFSAKRTYDGIILSKQKETAAQAEPIPFGIGEFDFIGQKITVTKENCVGLRFDFDKIPADAVIRNVKSGDTFTKFGGGTKPLRKYLIDKKIPQEKRSKLAVLASGNEILMIFGVEISDKIKVSNTTTKEYFAKID